MAFVILNKGRYIAKNSGLTGIVYTNGLQNAELYSTYEEALRNKCGDETIQEVHI